VSDGTAAPTPQQKLAAFWDERYAPEAFAYGTEPNDFLVHMAARIAPGGRVLCLADGEGRNGVWLARQGFRVTSVDIAANGLAKARQFAQQAGVQIETVCVDVTQYDFGAGAWDAIVSIFLHLPPKARRLVHGRCVTALATGGVFIFEGYGTEQLRYGTGGPKEPDLLPGLADVVADLDGLRIDHSYEGTRSVVEGALHHGEGWVVQVAATKEKT
jgi:SAM-dependent methyltransferase